MSHIQVFNSFLANFCVWYKIGALFHSVACSYPVFLERAMAPHASTLAWKIPWMEEPGGLQSMGLPRVGHD